MFFEIILFTAWLCGSVLLILAALHFGRKLIRKIEEFFDGPL